MTKILQAVRVNIAVNVLDGVIHDSMLELIKSFV
jgi:hypothetical protein